MDSLDSDTVRTFLMFVFVGLSAFLIGYELRTPVIVDHYTYYKPNQEFIRIAQKFAKTHEYNRTTYNCYNFSKDLVAELRQAGYDAEVVLGTLDTQYCLLGNDSVINDTEPPRIYVDDTIQAGCVSAHAWVKVPIYIEATTGRILAPYEIGGVKE